MAAMGITTPTPGVNMTGSSTQGIRLVATFTDPDGNVLV